MRVMFDTNVVLDVLLDRAPHSISAAQLLSLVDRREVEGVLCATTITTIHYLATKTIGRRQAAKHVKDLLSMFEIASVDHDVLKQAMELDFRDYEDAVLHEAARSAGVTAIVTRNGQDFAQASLPILSPVELLSSLAKGPAPLR